MSQPPQYIQTTNFTEAGFNTEFSNLKTTLDTILNNLEVLQRDDDRFKDGVGEPHVFNLSDTSEGFLKFLSGTWSFVPNTDTPAETAQAAAEIAQAAAEAARDLASTYKNDAEASKLAAETAQAAAEVAQQMVASSENIQTGSFWYAVSTGTEPNYEVTLSPTPTALVAGLFIHMKAHATNTGAATIKVNTFSAKSIKSIDGSDLNAGDIPINAVSLLVYDGTNFQISNLTRPNNEFDTVKSNLFRVFDKLQENHAGSLIVEKAWSDSFVSSNGQGADEANSSGFQHDLANALYQGTTPGTAVNSDKDYNTETNFNQQEWDKNKNGFGGTTSQATIASGTAVTITADTSPNGKFPTNCAKGLISFDSGSTWYSIDTRNSDTQLTLKTSATNGTFDYIIRMSDLSTGAARLATIDGTIYGSDITAGQTYTTSNTIAGGSIGNAFDNNTGSSIDFSSNPAQYPQFLKVQYSSSKRVAKVRINVNGAEARGGNVSFTIDGSNDDSNWTTLHSETGYYFSSGSSTYDDFTFTNNYHYVYYRMNWTISGNGNGSGDNGGLPTWYETEMMEIDTTHLTNEYVSLCDIETKKTKTPAWTDINSATVSESLNSQNIYYWLAFDPASGFGDGTEIKIFNTTDNVWRVIAKKETGAWKYNNDGSNSATYTGVASTVNDMLHAISQAISTQAGNRMTGANIAAITDTQWEEANGWSTSVNSMIRGLTLYSNNSTQSPYVSQYRINHDADRGEMDLKSKTYDPNFVPKEAYFWARAEHSDADGPGTFSITRNGGTEWTTVSMTQQGLPLNGDVRILRGTIDITGQTSGQDLRCRYQTTQGKDQFLHSWGLLAKA
jgi:hypothetical protein